ncbi:6-pyruvoyl trahydropterin synthase family protein [Streptomyces pinistramenti]|uniref:6-pyruvoyl trahydropterin synthase family protein n=1 Tax=Streptomyces pinistramenti TaxID=2884812 RepID=UPI001D05CB8D|nr:6-carboxytetrahydropterin synthase [Streptomyces pinistramenti]MCB5908094.1 6-carboxytetrahydropterin synthase [Streptomyces pinistramenti]
MSGGSWRIGKTFRFEATRTVDGRFDGHSFVAEAVMASPQLSEEGFVVDFGALAGVKRHIDEVLDHRYLSNVLPDASDEGLGRYLTEWAQRHLPGEVTAVLEGIRIRTGRPPAPPAGAAASFEASHRLAGLPAGHPCGRLHGHSYLVTIPPGGADGARAAGVPGLLRRYLETTLHGEVLNDAVEFNPTSELLAHHLVRWLEDWGVFRPGGRGVRVRVSETETSWAEFEGRRHDGR